MNSENNNLTDAFRNQQALIRTYRSMAKTFARQEEQIWANNRIEIDKLKEEYKAKALRFIKAQEIEQLASSKSRSQVIFGALTLIGLILFMSVFANFDPGRLFIGLLLGGVGLHFGGKNRKEYNASISAIKEYRGELASYKPRLLGNRDLIKGYVRYVSNEIPKPVSVEGNTPTVRGMVKLNNDFQKELQAVSEARQKEIEQFKERKENRRLEFIREGEQLADFLQEFPESVNLYAEDWYSVVEKRAHREQSYATIGRVEIIRKEGLDDLLVEYLVPFLSRENVIIEAGAGQMDLAVQLCHRLTCHFLLAHPPGNARLLLIDPVGLGENASPFVAMPEELYGKRVWVDGMHIDKSLTEYSRNIENVIQKYLQNKFENIAAYNASAGEVQEAYHLLQVYHFPTNFSSDSAQRLKSIMRSGPKTGIHAIVIVEKGKALPFGFDLRELKAHAVAFDLQPDGVLDDVRHNVSMRIFSQPPLPIPKIIEHLTKGYDPRKTIKVPFVQSVPERSAWWTEKAGREFIVPIGRSGAQDQLDFKFDNKVAPHGLLVGMTGSGKSNLLHVIILNSLIRYSPDELELYLIDFKGGVEFKPYAKYQIPHARTIAIESDREFGLSVMEGLEAELFRRERAFRRIEQQSIDAYQEMNPDLRFPRILLIIDEFQVFFAQDDRIHTRVEQILENIVRKGRAFGINILLATQSLSGASLPRATREMIAVRLALMCSDQDSRLILADDNPQAKLLKRPGEGIYNASRGLIEDNRPFQTYFLDLKAKEHVRYIEGVKQVQAERNWERPDKQICFDGSAASYLHNNFSYMSQSGSSNPKVVAVWLGEPVTIDQDVAAAFRRQSGSNMLCVGSDEARTLPILIASILSIIAHHQPYSANFYFLNFLSIDLDHEDLDRVYFRNLPFETLHGRQPDIEGTLAEIHALIQERLQNNSGLFPNVYLHIWGFQRGRKFRKDGYSLSEASTQLKSILQDGPDVGVFTFLHVDTMTNFDRSLESSLLPDFSQRIALQMPEDSSRRLIDSDAAAKLGDRRGLYYDDIEGKRKKFRPYELAEASWVEERIELLKAIGSQQ
ncbi:MAG: FtsK/SpoIIIE domain-containing protein [Bacteroidota bacterium]